MHYSKIYTDIEHQREAKMYTDIEHQREAKMYNDIEHQREAKMYTDIERMIVLHQREAKFLRFKQLIQQLYMYNRRKYNSDD